jgi:large subunit ribosomal protein L21
VKGKALDIMLLNRILLIVDDLKMQIGRPIVKTKKLEAIIIQHFFAKKFLILRFKNKKHYKKLKGFRPKKTRILVKNLYSV